MPSPVRKLTKSLSMGSFSSKNKEEAKAKKAAAQPTVEQQVEDQLSSADAEVQDTLSKVSVCKRAVDRTAYASNA